MSAVPEGLVPAFRSLRPDDINAVSALEAEVYEFPWSAGIFRDCLLAGYTSVALELDHRVQGYSIMSVAAGEAHLLNICIAKALRGQGIGRRLLDYMLERARSAGAEKLFLEVRPSNQRALELYRQADFQMVGVRPSYYRARQGKEDAAVLVRNLLPSRE